MDARDCEIFAIRVRVAARVLVIFNSLPLYTIPHRGTMLFRRTPFVFCTDGGFVTPQQDVLRNENEIVFYSACRRLLSPGRHVDSPCYS